MFLYFNVYFLDINNTITIEKRKQYSISPLSCECNLSGGTSRSNGSKRLKFSIPLVIPFVRSGKISRKGFTQGCIVRETVKAISPISVGVRCNFF